METLSRLKRRLTRKPALKLSPWLRNTLSGLVGTTIGIILTFGTRSAVESYKKLHTAKAIIKNVIDDMEKSTNSFSSAAERMEKECDLLMYVYNLYPDSIGYADTAKVDSLFRYLGNMPITVNNRSAEAFFNSNNSAWEAIGDDEVISLFGYYFDISNKIYDKIERVNEEKQQLLFSTVALDETEDVHSNHDFFKLFMKRHDVRTFILRYNMDVMAVKGISATQKEMLKQIKARLSSKSAGKKDSIRIDTNLKKDF